MNKMTIGSSSSTEDVVGGSGQNEPPDGDYVEADPMHRYIRYDEVLGRGAYKTVYRGFDEVDGIEIAWNQIRIDDVLRSPDDLERLYSEVHLLKSLKHANIIKFYSSWVDDQNKTINIITELFTSGSLRQYRKKHKNVDMKAVKNWARQILCGLSYLHGHNPPVIHRDLKCDNIFVNGNHGEVKIGDLGLATVMQQPNARSVIGTPEFMAPELYDEEYNELVDIYSFGMCLLEMITLEYPYSECNNAAQIYRKVTNGVKPLALGKVKDPQVRVIIEKCLSPASERLSAKELLKDPFFQYVDPREIARHPLKLPAIIPKPLNKGSSSIASDVTTVSTAKTGPLSMDIDFELKPPAIAVTPGPVSCTSTPQQTTAALEFERSSKNHDFKLKGEKTDSNTITLVLRIADARGPVKNVHFMFYLDSDTALAVAGEMVEHLEFSSQDVTFIAEFIDFVIMKLVPGWKPSCVDKLPGEATHVFEDSKAAGQVSFGYPWDGVQRSKTMKNEGSDDALSPSESGSPCAEISSADGSVHQADHGNNAFAKAADMMSQTGVDSSSSLATLEDQELFGSFASDISAEYTQVSTLVRDSTEELDPDMNLNMSVCNLRDISNIPRIQSNASSEAYDADEELKSEFVSIEMQYQQWFRELAKQQEEALASARKRWEAKKKLRAG